MSYQDDVRRLAEMREKAEAACRQWSDWLNNAIRELLSHPPRCPCHDEPCVPAISRLGGALLPGFAENPYEVVVHWECARST